MVSVALLVDVEVLAVKCRQNSYRQNAGSFIPPAHPDILQSEISINIFRFQNTTGHIHSSTYRRAMAR